MVLQASLYAVKTFFYLCFPFLVFYNLLGFLQLYEFQQFRDMHNKSKISRKHIQATEL